MARKTTDRTLVKIRKCWAGRYEWVRLCDGTVIMEAEQGVMQHDPKAWLVTFYSNSMGDGDWTTDDNEVTDTLRDAKSMATDWAKALAATNDRGLGTTCEY